MITKKSSKLIKRSFEKTAYKFCDVPEYHLTDNFGIYVHIPFCYSKCSFCPFYTEVYSEGIKDRFMIALLNEISDSNISGKANWVYFGGGTPNTLNTLELESIVKALFGKVEISDMGIELIPELLNKDYLRDLKIMGFTKISLGIQSLSSGVMGAAGRKNPGVGHIKEMISYAKYLGLWVNTDFMIGLPNQDKDSFIEDINIIRGILPDQITVYPFMPRGLELPPIIDESTQYEAIEDIAEILISFGYKRKSIWAFTIGDHIYDLTTEELFEDHIGFGPSAFSSFLNWNVVNPKLDTYLINYLNGKRMAFVASKSKAAADCKEFARMIYTMGCSTFIDLPVYLKLYLWILLLTGHGRKGRLTKKGRMFAHNFIKAIIEPLTFPVLNPDKVENYSQYLDYIEGRL